MRRQERQKRQESLTLEAWLQDLSEQLASFQELYELKKKQETNESNPVPSIADHYFERALASYLVLIEIVGDYISGNPLKLLDFLTSKDQRLEEFLGFIDIRHFVSHLFHPYFETNEGQGYYVIRMDQNCYRLALLVQGAIKDLKTVEGGLYGLVKKKFNNRLAKITFALRNRIECYEFNLHFLDVKTKADGCNVELLVLCDQAKQLEPDYATIAKQLSSLLVLPIAAPEYQLDGSVITIDAKEGAQRGNEITFTRYSFHVMEFLISQARSLSVDPGSPVTLKSAQRLAQMQSQDLFSNPSICNVYLVDVSVKKAQALLEELKLYFPDNADLNAAEKKLVALQKKRDVEAARFQPVGENNQWVKAVHERLRVFLEAFKQYANFDPEVFSFFTSSIAYRLCTLLITQIICRPLLQQRFFCWMSIWS